MDGLRDGFRFVRDLTGLRSRRSSENRRAAVSRFRESDLSREGAFMLYRIGRLLQIAGMIVLPIAIAGNVARPDEVNLGTMLSLTVFGVILFYLGREIQHAGRPK
jgi:hypothetical protein